MARGGNPFYYQGDQQLGAALGATLGKALFGDPAAAQAQAEARAKMALMGAQTQESTAHAGLYGKQSEGVGIQNNAALSLPDLIQSLVPHAAPVAAAPTGPVDPLAPLPEAQAAPAFNPQQFRAGLPALMAAMAQMQGDKVDPNKVIGGMAAMFGNDEFGRRGMVGEGITPGKDFALTPERADDIAQQGYAADYRKGTDEARINHASDIPVATIQAGSAANVARINHLNDLPVARINHENDIPVAEIAHDGGRTGGWAPRSSAGGDNADRDIDGKEAVMSQRLGIGLDDKIPTSRLGEVFDAIAVTEGNQRGSRANRNNNPGNLRDGAFARNQPGYIGADADGYAKFATHDAGRQAGVALLSTYSKRGQQSIRDIVEGLPKAGKPAAAKAAPQVSAADLKMVDGEIDAKLGPADNSKVNDKARAVTRKLAVAYYQQGGNPVQAVQQAIHDVANNGHQVLDKQAAAANKQTAAANKPPVAGARKAPDGNWYVKHGNGWARVVNG